MAWVAGMLCVPFVGLAACDGDGGGDAPATCTTTVAPSDNDAEAIQTAFEDAASGDTICLAPGSYSLVRELSLSNKRDITLRGDGATRDEVVLDFAAQTVGDDGLTVNADGFTVENLTLKNTRGNGIVVKAEESTFRNIRVFWDAGSVVENGAYAVYPNDCKKTIIEDSEISGASDASIYVGSCEYAIVRRNKVYASVAGIEIENSFYADVYENEVYDNTAGILVFALPNLDIKEVREVLVRDNDIYDNNRANFAEAGTIVSNVPNGLGMLVMGAKQVEIRDNTFTDNDGAAMLLVSFDILATLADITSNDPATDKYLEQVYVHGNTYTNNGTAPGGALTLLGPGTLENVVWDGDTRDETTDPMICLGPTPTSFRNFNSPDGLGDPSKQSTDTAGHTCTLDALPELSSFDDMVAR